MGAFLARHGKQLAFIPLLLLVGVLALRLVDTVRDGSDDSDTTGVDETAAGAEDWSDGNVEADPSDPATRAERRRGQATDGLGDSGRLDGGSSSGGGGTVIGGGGSLSFTPVFTPPAGGSTGGGSAGGTGSGGTGGGGTGTGGSGTGGGDTGGGDTDSGTGGGGPSPTPSPSPTTEPEPDPDANGDGRVTLLEARNYCVNEKGLNLGDQGYFTCINEAQQG